MIGAILVIGFILLMSFIFYVVRKDNLYEQQKHLEEKYDTKTVKRELIDWIQKYKLDSEFETPAFILAEYIWNCLIVSKEK